MNFIMTVFGYPFGWLMYGLYHLVSNYGVALVLFTIIVKLLLFPLGLKQQKSTVKMQIIQPKIQEIQAKYKNNQAKMNEELQALYSKENYNPMSGCGTLLIQFPVIFGLLDVVYKPLTHLLRFSKETITALTEVAGTLGIATTGYAPQISIYQSVMQNPAAYSSVGADVIAKIQSLDMGFRHSQPALAGRLELAGHHPAALRSYRAAFFRYFHEEQPQYGSGRRQHEDDDVYHAPHLHLVHLHGAHRRRYLLDPFQCVRLCSGPCSQ
mgnify:CR=1 FL=1